MRSPINPKSEIRNPKSTTIDSQLLDFLADHRFLNGTQTMLINLDRCTRCDDCVRACAATHDNNPRFIRQGPKHDNLMVANACMHCVDPVCMIGCPTGAIARDAETGTVRINDRTCIGCSTCANSCPYEAIRMVEIREPGGRVSRRRGDAAADSQGDEVRLLRGPADRAGVPECLPARCAGAGRYGELDGTGEVAGAVSASRFRIARFGG